MADELAEAKALAEYWKQIAIECKPYVAELAERDSVGYGYYRPSNPHDFTPDAECCTEEEIANHKAACDAFDAGAYTHNESSFWATADIHIQMAPWGIGSYVVRDEKAEEILAAIAKATGGVR